MNIGFLPVQRCASEVYAMALYLSVCLFTSRFVFCQNSWMD